jgi:hypothetical protein
MTPAETTPGIGGGENEGEWWRWIQVYLIRTFVNATMFKPVQW